MHTYAFRLLNVFAQTTFGGNPLCVFEDARGLDDQAMLDLARQFNLSETTFILPSAQADARVRIFTPGYEMRFAGHPTLGRSEEHTSELQSLMRTSYAVFCLKKKKYKKKHNHILTISKQEHQ